MTITGPSGTVKNLTKIVEADIRGIGNGNFSVEFNGQNGIHGDLYVCMASNGVSNSSHNVTLKGLSVTNFAHMLTCVV